MSSEEIKEMLDEWYLDLKMELWEDEYEDGDEEGEPKKAEFQKALGKWKRLSKTKNKDGDYERIFENRLTKEKVLVIEEEIIGFLADGKYLFHIDSNGGVMISDAAYFKKNGYCSDWQLSHLVAVPCFMGEEAEAFFSSEEDIETTRKELLKFGFIEDKEFSNFLCNLDRF